MSALNIKETNALRHVTAVLERVLRQGFDPNGGSAQSVLQRKEIELARSEVKTVTAMKGHYPN